MLAKLTYPAFLTGRPARHRDEKRCLLALETELDVSVANAEASSLVMTLDSGYNNGVIELKQYRGQFYQSLGIAPEDIAQYTKTNAFDTRNEVLGTLAHDALRGYFTIRFDSSNPIPPRVAMRDNQFLMEGDALAKIFRMSREFVVAQKDQHNAADLERKARQQFERFLILDGCVWFPTREFIYSATARSNGKPGVVSVTTSASHYADPHKLHVVRHSNWSDPHTRYFSVLSPEAAAQYGNVALSALPKVDVLDPGLVDSDFEAMELVRCGRNVLDEIGSAASPPDIQEFRTALLYSMEGISNPDWSADPLADVLERLSTAVRGHGNGALKRFTPDHIDDFVSRWHSRQIEPLQIVGPAFKA
jgi:hypothetical protein